ncbi:uncharacterized protein LOC110110567 isoform X2 [Dendrobium catenatum]|uniref:uncharacterized protein LOC110110567 isoform X2 n=1 Tax=Dendrobium catenatum TaxID=906689 RepID=UPI00109FA90E|nr:uncharacterized protein LOC110110567 isoform X2 [Dendrobium catenatum]
MALPPPLSHRLRSTFSPSVFLLPSTPRVPLAFLSSNGYFTGGRQSLRNPDKIYRRLDSCLVVPPPAGRRPVAIVKFLGGAFIGAAPELTYSYLMELLANEGFLIVSVPYGVTFDHTTVAREVYERFHSCLDRLVSSGVPDSNLTGSELCDLPLCSVGHSNGALLQMLVGSYFPEKIPKIGPITRQLMPLVEASPIYSMARTASGDVWKALLDSAGAFAQELDQEIMASLTKFVDQLPSVIGQVNEGISEFRPTPLENREFFKKSYRVPHTLLVKFNVDAIDESDVLEDILRPRTESFGGTLEKITLSGNHLTPCIQDVKWQVGYHYTPADALAQSLKSLSLNEIRVLARTIADWLKGRTTEMQS